MQSTLNFRTNRDLFSNHYLTEHLPETEPWEEVTDEEVWEAREAVRDLYASERDSVDGYNEAQLERRFIRPLFEELGITFEIEESVERGQRRPDYAFFADEGAREDAFERRNEGGDFYENAIAVADAKRWGRKLDTRGERERDFENPSYQIHVYLQETPAQWAVLTNGKKWRLYYGPTSHRLDSYYEIDLPTLLEQGGLEEFKYFYLFFRREAFVEDASGDCFLDDVYDESTTFAEALGEDLQDNIYEAIRVLAEGFLDGNDDLDKDDLDRIHDSSLIYLYRLIFVLYAESEGRKLLPTNNDIYSEHYSLNQLKQTVAANLDDSQEHYLSWQTDLWDQLGELFELIDEGSESQNIDPDLLYIPAYNGGLFRTNPDKDDSVEAKFLASHEVGDAYLAEVLDLLTRRDPENGSGKVFVDYSSLDIRHLGSIYEGLLEYQLNVADEALSLDDGEYVSADNSDDVVVAEGDVYLTTDSGERKSTGSYYTPEYVVEYIVESTLGPLVNDIREDFLDSENYGAAFAEEFAEKVFDLKILDPAMGSGHFLTSAVDYLAREIINAQERQAEQQGVKSIDRSHDINWARRKVAQRCIYGVDVNPLAVELTKVSLWLRTLAADQPLAFLDHHLRTGNSLVGTEIENIETLNSQYNGDNPGKNAQLSDFGVTFRGTREQLMNLHSDLIAIENQDRADAKKMEDTYRDIETNELRRRFLALANVKTAEMFGMGVPDNAYEKLARVIDDEQKWHSYTTGKEWFEQAQRLADEFDFFHWTLEFPEVFYSEDGGKVDNAGFDVVLGNPPYVRMEEFKRLKSYLDQQYTTHAARTDLYIYFIERSVSDLLCESGEYGVIVSNKFLRANYGTSVRSLLARRTNIREIADFGGLPVFPDATVRSAILLVRNTEPDGSPPRYVPIESLDFDSLAAEIERSGFEVDPDGVLGEEWRLVNRRVSAIIKKLENEGDPLKEVLQDGDICRGVVTGRNAAFFINEDKRDELISQDPQSKEVIKPMIRGEDIGQYHIQDQGRYMLYMPHGVDIERYPAIEEHLRQYKEELEGRATEQAWYELQQPQEEYIEYFDGAKILYPEIAPEMRFAYEQGPLYPNNKCFFLPTERLPLMALLNSTLSAFYLRQILAKLEGVSGDDVYYEFRRQYMKRLPVCNGIDEVHEETGESLGELADKMMQLHEERQSLNLSLLDYIGVPGDEIPEQLEGRRIEELQMPASGVAGTPLSKTSEDLDGLRIESVSFDGDTDRLLLSVDVSYKPSEDEARETDQYGRLEENEFETYEAMVFTDLSGVEAALIRNFLPVAVEKREGYAGFRRNATTTNTLLDRLKDITLPDVDEVRSGLQQYVDVQEQADEIEQRIEQTNGLIDQIVYDLYGLTDEEIEIVESTVQDV